MEDEKACESCSYWESAGPSLSHGWCHRYAPRPVSNLTEEGNYIEQSVWAQTSAIDWCGEYVRGRAR